MRSFRIAGLGSMRRSFASWVCALCLLAAGATGARADLVYTPDETPDGATFLVVSGFISQTEDFGAFSAAVAASHPRAVVFDSPGGSIDKAMELGRLIRSLDLETIQSRKLECASACALAFLGGVARYAEPGSIGVHKTWFAEGDYAIVNDAVAAIQQITADVIGYLVEMGADPALLEVALAYESNDIRYLSGSEMARFRVTTPPDEESTADAVATSPMAVPLPAQRPVRTAVPAAAPAPTAVADAQAIFYQERTKEAEGTAEMGTVVWSLVQESPGNGALPEPMIRAEAVIPGDGIRLSMTIKRNIDRTIPASHIVEMIFTTPENFDGGGIDNLLDVVLKESEVATGSPLLATPVKITDDYFLVALSDGKADVGTNLALLRNDQWIDVPLVYKSGRRALFTMEKGAFGNWAFNGALNAWQWSASIEESDDVATRSQRIFRTLVTGTTQ